jgi:NIMA (never in mitosis gene a)-related kinase
MQGGGALSEFDFLKVIGRGQFGVVQLVRCKEDKKLYVCKIIDMSDLGDAEKLGSLQEVNLLKELRFPFIVPYKTSFISQERLHIVMYFCEGGDIASQIKIQAQKGKFFSESQILDWFVQIAMALQFCHHHKIIHRDLKSQNIFLTKKHNIRLGDFGIARVLNGTSELAMSVVGTPFSMSPEVCENKPYGYKSDIWALGCVLYEMCVLKHAFDSNNLLGLVWKIVQETYPPIPDQYSASLRSLIDDMLSKDPNRRPSIDEILDREFIRERIRVQLGMRTNQSGVFEQGLISPDDRKKLEAAKQQKQKSGVITTVPAVSMAGDDKKDKKKDAVAGKADAAKNKSKDSKKESQPKPQGSQGGRPGHPKSPSAIPAANDPTGINHFSSTLQPPQSPPGLESSLISPRSEMRERKMKRADERAAELKGAVQRSGRHTRT